MHNKYLVAFIVACLIVLSALPVFADMNTLSLNGYLNQAGLPAAPEDFKTNSGCVVWLASGDINDLDASNTDVQGYAYFYPSDDDITFTFSSSVLSYSNPNESEFAFYHLKGNGTNLVWSLNKTINKLSGNGGMGSDNIVFSSEDVLRGDGSVFFHRPLTLSETVDKSLMMNQTTIHGAMGILTICGVSCLALLIVLVILPKTLHKFLN